MKIEFDRMIAPESRLVVMADGAVILANPCWAEAIYTKFAVWRDKEGGFGVNANLGELAGYLKELPVPSRPVPKDGPHQ